MEAGKVEIMKVVEGVQGAEKLAELIERGKNKGNLSSSELLDVLESVHAQGLLHSDLKPGNVLYRGGGIAVCDWGRRA